MMLSISAPSMAQDVKSQVTAITKVVVDAKGDVNATKAQVKDFMKANKKNAEALAGLGRAFLTAKNYEQAKVYADMAMKFGKNDAAGYILRGDIASAEDNGGEAASYYEMATQQAPQEPSAYVKYARVYQKVDPQGAVAMLEKLRSVKPDYPVDAAAGYMYSSNNQLKSAMNYYNKVQDPSTLEDYILFDYASTAYVLDEFEKAQNLADAGIHKYPQYSSFNRIGLFAADKQKKYTEAVTYGKNLFAATDTIKYTAADYSYYADALINTGDTQAAVDAYKKISEVDPENKEVNKLIAMAYSKGKQFDYAAIYAVNKQATVYHLINPDVKAGIALPYYKKLVELVEAKADKTDSDVNKLATAYTYLAVHYIQNDKKTEAKHWAAKLLEIRPDDPNATQIMNIK